MNHPIENIQWKPVDELFSNDYNPNIVFNQELALLKYSILKTGWIQPILITSENIIIDGFHRTTLVKNDKDVKALTNGLIPCAVMELSEPERIMLTIRINRAKGSHVAFRMSDCIKQLINDHGMSIESVCKGIGANKDEIELLLCNSVFEKKGINESTKYSMAWVPRK
jgi:ParB-like chromosome segregation protein Spo0J